MQRSPVPYQPRIPVLPGSRTFTPAPVRKAQVPNRPALNLPGNRAGTKDVPRRPSGGQAAASRVPAAYLAQLRGLVEEPAGPLLSLLGFYVILHTGDAGEVLKFVLHFPFPIVIFFALTVPVISLVVGSPGRFFSTPMALPWVLLNLWMGLSSTMSYSPGWSIKEYIPFALRLQIFPILFCAVATTSKSTRRLLAWTALGMFPILLLCVVKGEMQEGYRFALVPPLSLSNPNDLAFQLLWGSMTLLPFLMNKGALAKVLTLAAIALSFWFILKTASRANFLTIFAVVAVGFLLAAPRVRMIMAMMVPLCLAVTLPLLPRATLSRILTIAVASAPDPAPGGVADELSHARDSEEARKELAKLAINTTLRHPVFGVGMLMFADETADYFTKTYGTKAPWQTAHNSYLKISSENGIPGLIFYVWAIGASILATWRVLKGSRGRPGFEDTFRSSVAILLTLVVYAVGTFFCDIVYLSYCPITIGLAAANFIAFRNEDLLAKALAEVSATPILQPYGAR